MSLHCPACMSFAEEDGDHHDKYDATGREGQRQPRCYPAESSPRGRGFKWWGLVSAPD
jgi:hypothetical protein